MNIYISGISGTGMGPLAEVAIDAGYQVSGSDIKAGAITPELLKKGIEVHIGAQDGTFLEQTHSQTPIDLFIYSSSLPKDHPELLKAEQLGIKTGKRDLLLNRILQDKNLKLIAVAGTHGKTTTTSITTWLMHSLGLPESHIVGSTIPFAPAGQYQPNSEYFIYEADEFDRNFLAFHPYISMITAVTYDHADVYPTKEDYDQAFAAFRAQSQFVIEDIDEIPGLTLLGSKRRYDASLAITAVHQMTGEPIERLVDLANQFPGAGRRFERLADNVYSDYAHLPSEISAALDTAHELSQSHKGLIILYQPLQNSRQYTIRSAYKDLFTNSGAEHIYWIPTYLIREDPTLPILTPEQLSEGIPNVTPVKDLPNADLEQKIKDYMADDYTIVLITGGSAGGADTWLRSIL